MLHPVFKQGFQVALITAFLLAVPADAQQNNFIVNGDFQRVQIENDLWDGVDRQGFLAGFPNTVRAITERGFGNIAMPVSPVMKDLTGDGKKDLMTADPLGYYRIYINEGTEEEPKFSTGDILPLFLSARFGSETETVRVPRIDLAPMGEGGRLDLMIGDYVGRILRVPNAGSAMQPNFPQPRTIASTEISTGGRYWANLMAPLFYDWTGNRTLDLITGEGSYSANAVHLLINEGSNARPQFSAEDRHYLAFGDGREHLIPTVVDYNNNGYPDLLVSDRTGRIGVYLHPERRWQPGDELVFSHFIEFGNRETLGGLVAPYAVDYNGNGLFDLIIGRPNGRVALAVNTGEPGEPKFERVVDIRGEDRWATILNPAGWSTNYQRNRGNLRAYISAVSAEDDPSADPQAGRHVLKAGYRPSINKVAPANLLHLPTEARERSDDYFTFQQQRLRGGRSADSVGYPAPANLFVVRQTLTRRLRTNAEYEISFRVKGQGVRDAQATLAYIGQQELAPEKVVRGGRGSARVERSLATDEQEESFSFQVGGQWNTVSRNVRVNFRNRDLRDMETVSAAVFEIAFVLPDQDSTIYIDDVKLVER